MPKVRRSSTIDAPAGELWPLVADPYHLPRWWPRVQRVEAVDENGWTSVLMSDRGRLLRADFRVTESEEPRRRAWRQELEDTPFEKLLAEATTSIELEPAGEGATTVTIEMRQRLRGTSRMAGWLFRRAGRRQLDEALAGLREISTGD
jgi:uncharacterized protein YndB with AHSA1/START domain